MTRQRAGRSTGRAYRALAIVLGATLVATSCTSESSSDTYLPPSPPVIEVTMREYSFTHEQAVPGGQVVFRVHNAGTEDHELLLALLPEDLPPIDEQLRGPTRRGLGTVARMLTHPPGSTGTFAVFLEPGRYAMICFLRDAKGVPNALKGMSSEFRVP